MTAVGHIEAGRFDEAVATLDTSAGLALKTPVGRNVIGDIYLKTGRLHDALKSFDREIRMAPSFPEAHCNRGVVLQEMGRLEEALRAQQRALKLRPGYAMASFNHGNILRQLGRLDDASTAYQLAVKSRPDFSQARLASGMTFLDLGQPMLALTDFASALKHDPHSADAMAGRASALHRMGQTGEAIAAVRRALAADGTHAQALLFHNVLLVAIEDFEKALEPVDALISYRPEFAEAHAARAVTLTKMRRLDDALAASDRAIELAPREAAAYVTRSIVLGELGRFDEQWEALQRAERLGADGADIHHARGLALGARGDYAGAIEAFERAIEIEPDNRQAHENLALAHLTVGDLQRAWPEYEWRLKKSHHTGARYADLEPQWDGREIAGKKLLVYSEQGHGDTIQFLRFLSLLEGRGADVTFITHKAMRGFLAENFPSFRVTDDAGLRGEFDFQIAIMSLPFVFETSIDTIPDTVPYLSAGEGYIDKWAERLGQTGYKVGIVWQGNPEFRGDRLRSVPLKYFEPLTGVASVRLISLQVFRGLDQLDDLPRGMEVERLGEEVTNNPSGYHEVAGVMANLDLIVTSDTGPAHLAGAMGLPVWVALRDRPDWRWLTERTDSPWYPTMRLFRQTAPGDWPGLFQEITTALEQRVGLRALPTNSEPF